MNKSLNNHFDVIIIGAGLSGISVAYHVKTLCPNRTFAILEGRQNIGGTWDLFKYPGIRSDSDMYTLGFDFRPWTSTKAIADAKDIMEYLNGAVEDYDLKKHIQFGKKVLKANWSSENAYWELTTKSASGEELRYTANFIFGATGYYDYDEGFTPDFKGMDDFKGQIIHPQQWPEDLDYSNKKIVVIGSGATAITLIPNLMEKAAHVTMLQRSPSYIVPAPAEDKIANFLNKVLPFKLAYSINRWRKIKGFAFTYNLSKKYPKTMAKLMIGGMNKEMGGTIDVKKHFTPKYKPWDQRICLSPDSDFFKAMKSEKSSIVTDHIETFTEKGILLQSGKAIEADIIVTATGLKLVYLGKIALEMDKQPVVPAKLVMYRGIMFSTLPNIAIGAGYTNASWTLKIDLTSKYIARILNYMSENGYSHCIPTLKEDSDLKLSLYIDDLNSNYWLRYLDQWPKQGDVAPWRLKQSYSEDRKVLGRAKLEDGALKFHKTPNT